MLEISHLKVNAGGKQLLALDSLSVKRGEFCAISGANGAGKSTLLRCLAGDLPYSGNVLFHDFELHKWKHLERARHIAVLPQQVSVNFAFKAMEVVELGLTPLSISRRDARQLIRTTMNSLNCLHLTEKLYPQLSGGEQQRVNLARVFVQLAQAEHPPLLLLDEALSAQDLGQQHSLLETIKHFCNTKEGAVVGVLHDLNHVLRYCDTSVLLEHGACLETGNARTVLSTQNIQRCWSYQPEFIATSSGRKVMV